MLSIFQDTTNKLAWYVPDQDPDTETVILRFYKDLDDTCDLIKLYIVVELASVCGDILTMIITHECGADNLDAVKLNLDVGTYWVKATDATDNILIGWFQVRIY